MVKGYRRVSVYAGPGAGKSVLATWLFAELKIAGTNIQFVEEYVKKWAYEKKPISSFDQVYLFAKQMHKEDSYLKNGAEIIITDSPILQIGGYAKRNGDLFADELISIAQKFNNIYPSVNIFLDRDGIEYKQDGRYEDYDAARKTDAVILQTMKEAKIDYEVFRTVDRHKILEHVLTKIK